jgi:hypothetical protein
MKTIAMALLFAPLLLASAASQADEPASVAQKPGSTQSELALDHGPRATVTPAVKRQRQEAAKAASQSSQSK